MNRKYVIYQLIVRLFGNKQIKCKPYGTMIENGSGKFNDINDAAIRALKELGITHIWLTGVLEQATLTDNKEYGIPPSSPETVKGVAGSPYAIRDYYDVSPELAIDIPKRMTEFQSLIGRIQQQGLKVIMDFVPNHVAREYKSDVKPSHTRDLGEDDNQEMGFTPNNNYYYLPGQVFVAPYEHKPYGDQEPYLERYYVEVPAKVTGNDVFSATPGYHDWFDTVKLNYGVDITGGGTSHFDPIPDTWKKMYDILQFWAYKGVDGFRCDMVHMVPLAFWQWALPRLRIRYPSLLFIGEVYEPHLYQDLIHQGKFDYLYDKVGLYDHLRRLVRGEDSIQHTQHALNQSAYVSDHMLRFMENHDEQRLASTHVAGNHWAGIPTMTVSALSAKGPVMLYFGQEVGEKAIESSGFSGDDGRTTLYDYWHVPEHQKWMNEGKFDGGQLSEEQQSLRKFYQKLFYICHQESAITAGHFYELPPLPSDNPLVQHKVYAFLRYTEEEQLLIMANFDQHDTLWANVFIPGHAWECMQKDPFDTYLLTDILLSGQSFTLAADSYVEMPPWSAFVFKFARGNE